MKLHPISAGDMVRALRLLEARDEATRAAIAGVLGYEIETEKAGMPAITRPASIRPMNDAIASNLQWTRAMISTLARICTRSGPPEIEALVAAAAERKPMSSLALSISETASGADVLLDIGDHMAVFSRDQKRFAHLMRRVLGSGLVSTFRFAGSPVRGVLGESKLDFEAYRPARPGWPVVVLTDLGIGAGTEAAPLSEWREFSRLVRAAGCHLLVLVPHPPARWPAGLPSSMHIIPWDRATSVRFCNTAFRRCVSLAKR